MPQLFAPDLAEQIECVERELRYRRHVYPRRVAAKRMTQVSADRELERMEAVLATLKRLDPPAEVVERVKRAVIDKIGVPDDALAASIATVALAAVVGG
jgi:hypothetical protein